jgi:hypothetical protein
MGGRRDCDGRIVVDVTNRFEQVDWHYGPVDTSADPAHRATPAR